MSHFSSMAAKYTHPQQIVDTLLAMGVPEREIYALESLGVTGCQQMSKPASVTSSHWHESDSGCQIKVTERGMKEMARSAGANGRDVSMGVYAAQGAELGFKDCQCSENPGYFMSADPYEAGNGFAGYFTAMYQVTGLRGSDMEHSELHQDEDGNFRLVLRKRQEHKGRGSRIASRARQLVSGRRR